MNIQNQINNLKNKIYDYFIPCDLNENEFVYYHVKIVSKNLYFNSSSDKYHDDTFCFCFKSGGGVYKFKKLRFYHSKLLINDHCYVILMQNNHIIHKIIYDTTIGKRIEGLNK